jgi:hypothetical protein
MDRLLRSLFGDDYPLARHFINITMLFVLLLLCIFIARKTIPLLFTPGDTLTAVLQVIDAYAALLGLIGYAIWISLDMAFLLVEQHRKKTEK